MTTHHEAANPMDASIIDNIYYDGFGNIVQLNYSNGTTTDFTYNNHTRRLTGVNLLSGTGYALVGTPTQRTDLLNKTYTYDPYGNVRTVNNTSPGFDYDNALGFASWGIEGGEYAMIYEYDDLNRLTSSSGSFDGEPLELTMTYDNAGGLLTKEQTYLGHTYNLEYDLDGPEEERLSHKITSITDHTTSEKTSYLYDDAGNVKQINLPNEQQDFIWNELNYLRGVMNDNGVSHYLYDQNGERVMKGKYLSSEVGTNESFDISNMTLDGYTLYVNPYYVVTNYNTNAEGSKHYYMGSQRIASGQMSYTLSPKVNFPPESYNPTHPETPGGIVDLHDVLEEMALRRDQPFDIDLSQVLQAPELSDLKPFEGYEEAVMENPCQTLECRCAESIYWTEQKGEECEAKKVMYWYHPDYLGNTEYVTNIGGLPHQFFWYSPWGEPLVSQNLQFFDGFRSPYKFNAKELDEETGNYYYGARYYDPMTSIWLSVDPMSSERPGLTPYNFVSNNPVMRIDPTGMLDETYEIDKQGNTQKVDNTKYYQEQDGSVTTVAEGGTYEGSGTEVDRVQSQSDPSKGIYTSKSTMDGKVTRDVPGIGETDMYSISDEGEAKEFFEFAAQVSDVEWDNTNYNTGNSEAGGTNNLITTSHKGDRSGGLGFLDQNGATINYSNHSHPRHGRIHGGDGNAIRNLLPKNQDAIFKVFYPGTGKYQSYDKWVR